jgi:hypothetical protein
MSLAQPWRDSLKPEKLPETGETAPEAESENTWTKHDFRFDIIEQIS